MLITTVIFVMVSVIIIFGITTPTIKQIFTTRDIWSAKQSRYLSEAGAEDVMYRLKDSSLSSKLTSQETLTLNGYSAITQITDTVNGKTITTLSDHNGYKKTMETKVDEGEGTSFSYGILTGEGGFYLGGGADIIGNIYSNGPVTAEAGTTISGSAISASSSVGYFKDQSNETPTSTSNSIVFNNINTNKDFAQSFQPASTSPIAKVRFYMKKNGSPNDFTVSLRNNGSSVPGTTVLASATLKSSDVTTSYTWVDISFTTNPTITKDTTYWIVIAGNNTWGNSSDYYTIAANSSYTRGQAKIGVQGGTWNNTNPSGLDALFANFLGSASGQINCPGTSCVTIGSSSTDIVWASKVTGVSTVGTIYANVASNNNKKAVERDNPPTIPMATTQAQIDTWKTEATAGGTHSGNLSIGWAGGIVGPRKITGDLLVNGGGTLMITGTVWVQGSITVTSGGKIKISPSLGANSAVIVSDKYVSVDGGAQFEGSGTAGSYPIVVSTSVCPNTTPCATNSSAIYLSGGAGAVIMTAPFGKVHMNGGSGARSISGNMVYITGGGTVTYETGLANLSFTNGPSGGWQISGWKELEN